MASKWTRTTRRGTIHSTETWEGDRRGTSLTIAQPGAPPVSPELILWADTERGVVVGQEVMLPDAPAQAVADSLRKAITAPLPGGGPPRQPRRIRVSRPEIAEAIHPLTDSLGIQLEIAESLPLLDEVFRAFETQFGAPANQGYTQATEVPLPLLAGFFAAAAEFYRDRPWRALDDGEPVLLECADWTPAQRYAIVMGAGGAIKGIALYESWRDLLRVTQISADDEEARQEADRIPALALVYTRLSELGPRRVEEARAQGWTLASRNAYPVVVATGSGRESHWPTPAETRLLIASMRAIGRVVRGWRRTLGPAEAVAQTCRVDVLGEEVRVEVSFPTASYSEP